MAGGPSKIIIDTDPVCLSTLSSTVVMIINILVVVPLDPKCFSLLLDTYSLIGPCRFSVGDR